MNRLLAAALFTVACSHTRPAEMTAAEHRSEASAHQEAARKEASRYDSGRTVRFPGRSPWVSSPSDWTETYNPTANHLAAADRELRLAAEHLSAARSLESFETGACKDIAAPERAACPLLASWVSRVANTQTGLELQLKPQVDAADTHRRLACHLAFAQANGFQKPSCPLFVNGMTIELRGTVLVFTGATPQVVKQLQDQARRIFAPPEPPTAVSANQ